MRLIKQDIIVVKVEKYMTDITTIYSNENTQQYNFDKFGITKSDEKTILENGILVKETEKKKVVFVLNNFTTIIGE